MQETLYQTADAGDSLSDSGCRRHSIRQQMHESLHQTADAGVSPSDSGYRRHSIRQRIEETLYQTLLHSIGCNFLLLNNLFTLKYTELTCILYLEIESIH